MRSKYGNENNTLSTRATEEKYKSPNIPLLLLDLILLPIHIIRMVIIYYCGSKYNLKGFQFLDVIMHADKPYFNKDDCNVIDTIGKDYRVVIRDDSRIFPLDIDQYLEVKQIKSHRHKKDGSDSKSKVKTGSTVKGMDDVWDISSEDVEDIDDDDDKPKINKKNGDELDSKFIDDDTSSDSSSDNDEDEGSSSEEESSEGSSENPSECSSDNDNSDKQRNQKEVTESESNKSNNDSDQPDKSDKSKKISHNKVIDSIKAELDSAFDD